MNILAHQSVWVSILRLFKATIEITSFIRGCGLLAWFRRSGSPKNWAPEAHPIKLVDQRDADNGLIDLYKCLWCGLSYTYTLCAHYIIQWNPSIRTPLK